MDSIREIGENIKNSQYFKGIVKYEEPMSAHTTMKVGGAAAVYVIPEDYVSVAVVVQECRKNSVRLVVIGGGSNVVVSDEGINGVVLSTEGLDDIDCHIENETVELKDVPWSSGTLVKLSCGAGVTMNRVVDFCAEHGFLGLSCFAGLPGTCGGAAYMNARCYEKEISDVVCDVFYINLDEISQKSFVDVAELVEIYHNNKADWSYKHSPFVSSSKLIVRVDFYCTAVEGNDAEAFVLTQNNKYVEDRRTKGHFLAPSAGSVFKNNRAYGKPSGMLVDEAGLKGFSIGGAQISSWHGNFIINTGDAKSSDIKELVDIAIEKVRDMTGFVMEPEIIFI